VTFQNQWENTEREGQSRNLQKWGMSRGRRRPSFVATLHWFIFEGARTKILYQKPYFNILNPNQHKKAI